MSLGDPVSPTQAYIRPNEPSVMPYTDGPAVLKLADNPACGNGGFDEDTDGQSALQLRGLPYKATPEDIRAFLGEHAAHLAGDVPIFLVLNRDGRPSGFARVSFATPEAATKCRDELHMAQM
jgi:RNA recognition motif-containing protein